MSTLTPNYNLIKPDPDTDLAIVADINSNYDIIDSTLFPLDEEATRQSGEEYGLEYIESDNVIPGSSVVVSAGAWGTLFNISQSSPIEEATKWLLDLQFTAEKFSGADPASLSLRIDRGINHGGTMLLQGGPDIDHNYTYQEKAVVGAITTFTGFHAPVIESGLAKRYYFRIACFGETPNGHLLSAQVSPVGGTNSQFYAVTGKLTFNS